MSNDPREYGNNGEKRVIDPEVLDPEHGWRDPRGQNANRGYNNQGYAGHDQRRIYFQTFYGWPAYSVDQNACLAPCVTVILFLICLFQYGLLAGIGFVFFHVLFGVLGNVRASSQIMNGQPFNVWLWRLGNWLFSFLLTVWLSGGFDS